MKRMSELKRNEKKMTAKLHTKILDLFPNNGQVLQVLLNAKQFSLSHPTNPICSLLLFEKFFFSKKYKLIVFHNTKLRKEKNQTFQQTID
jgi:hypothetical protein